MRGRCECGKAWELGGWLAEQIARDHPDADEVGLSCDECGSTGRTGDDPTELTTEKLLAAMALVPEADPTLPTAIRLSAQAHDLMRIRFAPESPRVGLGFGGSFVGVRLYVDLSLTGTEAVPMTADEERAWLDLLDPRTRHIPKPPIQT